jgi:membrane protease YdiL (CAAX protease family)
MIGFPEGASWYPLLPMIGDVLCITGLFGVVALFLLRFLRGGKVLDILDTAGLYLPLVQALGSLYWLLCGCFLGKYTSMKMYGLYLRFRNPIPLYAFIVDICIFLFLKRLHAVTHKGEAMRGRFGGVVFASYLMIHASVRIVLNVFEKEDPIFLDLTLTQLAMAIYILFSISIFSVVFYAYPAFKTNTHSVNPAPDAVNDMKRLLFPAGLTVFYLMTTFLIYYLTRVLMVWKWPIQPVESLADAYGRLGDYLPVMGISVFILAWMKKNNEPIRPWFRWGRFTFLLVIGLLASIYYCLELLVFKHHVLRGMEFWPPAIIMSVMNAFCEESMYRLALYRAIISANYSRWVALIIQSVVYSLIHFMVVGAVLGLFSLVYGFLLGLIVQCSKSVSQAMVCHFVVDIGCIGMPMLRM